MAEQKMFVGNILSDFTGLFLTKKEYIRAYKNVSVKKQLMKRVL